MYLTGNLGVECEMSSDLALFLFWNYFPKIIFWFNNLFTEPGSRKGGFKNFPDFCASIVSNTSLKKLNFTCDGKEYKHQQFPQVFPDWMTPSTLKRCQLPEYIMAVYNSRIAGHYKVNPGSRISWFNVSKHSTGLLERFRCSQDQHSNTHPTIRASLNQFI